MRVLIVTDSFSPRMDGVAVSVDSLIHGLISTGHDVGVVFPGRRPGYEVDEMGTQRWCVSSFRTPLDGYPLSLASAESIARIIRVFGPDFISVQTIGSLGVASLRASHRLELPVALSWHTDFESYLNKYRLAWLFILPAYIVLRGGGVRLCRNLMRKVAGAGRSGVIREILAYVADAADLVVAPSARTASYLKGLEAERPVFVLSTGVEESELRGKTPPEGLVESIEATSEGSRIVYVGRLSREKGIDFLVEAFRHVIERRPQATLILVGPCEDPKTWLRLRAARVRLGANLLVVGPVERRMLSDLYRRVDVFATASVTETQGITVWEAALAGLPIIARDDFLDEDVCKEVLGGLRTPEEFGDAIVGRIDRDNRARETGGMRVGPTGTDRARLLVAAVDQVLSGETGGSARPGPWFPRDGAWREG
ncbi:glycosyltransferase [Streptosporangium sp. NBC_01495]|uniref:glycosyltransferase n=1 Tax=Streptosporangium sp. NBC_01495 TaxID=2903899 RepID=UPI002E360447|nr:glycosyltransferase [Streptosporangium sp. NBC_01495]